MNRKTKSEQVEVKLSKAQLQKKLQEIFKCSTSNKEALVEVYSLVFPYTESTKIEGHPVVDKNLWVYIWKLFMQLDRKFHPEEFAGAIWVNKGWGMNSGLQPWTIDFSQCRVIHS